MSRFILKVLYASQTGNAVDTAAYISREAKEKNITATIIDLNIYDITKLPFEDFIVFVVSTTGHGDIPDSMKKFWNFLLRKTLPNKALEKLKFALFGLGDSSYPRFNIVAKMLENRLIKLGAKLLFEKGLGDEQSPNGYEAQLNPWVETLWRILKLNFSLTYSEFADHDQCLSYTIKISDKTMKIEEIDFETEFIKALNFFKNLDNGNQNLESKLIHNHKNPFFSRVLLNSRLTNEKYFQNIKSFEFDISDSNIDYNPGDVLSIIPITDWKLIDCFIARLNLPIDCCVYVQSIGDLKKQNIVSLRYLIQTHLDISSTCPRQFFFKVLSNFSKNKIEKDRLRHFSSKDGSKDLFIYGKSGGKCVLDILNDFPLVIPTLESIFECCPKKIPRKYSITSSGTKKDKVSITLAIVEYKSQFNKLKTGLCTGWLKYLNPNENNMFVPLWIEEGKFSYNLYHSKPILFIATGTGIASFISFLRKKYEILKSNKEKISFASFLFYGCRYEAEDFLFKEELEIFKENGILDKKSGLITAFSRDQDEKIYVTHKLKEYSEMIYDLIVNKGYSIFVSGSAKNMPNDVLLTLENIISNRGNMHSNIVKEYFNSLKNKNRFLMETWS